MAHGPLPGAGDSGPVVEEKYHTGRVVRMAGVAALGGFLFGFDSAVVNGAVDALQEKFDIGDAIGFVVAIALLGSAVGAWFAGSLANKYGRRRVMVMAAVLFLIAAVGQAFPFGVADLMFWRFIGGAGIGIASVIAPMYIAEIAPAQLRGRLGSLQQLAIVLGILTTAITNYLILNAASAGKPETNANNTWLFGLEAWQWMFLVMLVPALVYGTLALTIPESPRYLVAAGRDEEAAQVLSTVLDGDQHAKVAEIKASLAGDHKPRFGDLKGRTLGLRPIVWTGIGLSVFQQFVGINVIFYYSTTLWQAVGFSEEDALTQSVITSVTNIVVTLVAIALIDKIGRRRLLITGSTGMTISLGVMAFMFSTATMAPGADGEMAPQLGDTQGLIALIAANAFVVFFGMSWGPGVWVLLGEMFNNRIRSTALGVAAAAQWLANFAVSTSFPSMAELSLWFTYGVYAVAALLSLLFVAKFVPETMGKSLEEME